MGAFFSGVARTPLTALVITFELTSSFDLLIPLMFSCVLSTAVSEYAFKGGLYEHLMRWNGIHLRGPASSESLKVLTAKDVMHKQFKSFDSKTSLRSVLETLGSVAQRGFPVVRKNVLVGVVTQADLSKLDQTELLDTTTVAEVMTPQPVAVNSTDSLDEILFLFSQYKFTWLPVTDHDRLVGLILQSDVLKALFEFESAADHQKQSATQSRSDAQPSNLNV
jgi:CIC family chloride channel protein